MRIFVTSIVVVALAALLLAIAAPWLVDQRVVQDRARSWIADLTGGQLQIDGRIDLRILPQPRLVIDDPKIRPTQQSVELGTIDADRLDLDLALNALLKGRIEIRDAHLIRPNITLQASTEELATALANLIAADGRVTARRINITDGIITDSTRGGRVSAVNASISVNPVTGQSELRFDGRSGGATLNLRVQLGALEMGKPTSLQMTGTAVIDGATSLARYRGILVPRSTGSSLEGRFNVGFEDAGTALAWWAPELGRELIGFETEGDVALEGNLEIEGERILVDQATATLGNQVVQGRIEVRTSDIPEIEAEFRTKSLTISPTIANQAAIDALLAAIPRELRGTITARADELRWRGAKLSKARLTSRLTGNRRLVVDELRVGIPGAGTARFKGEVGLTDTGPTASGQIDLSTRDTRQLLTVLGFNTASLSPDIRHLGFKSEIDLGPGGLSARNAELRIDAMRATGDLVFLQDPVPQLIASVDIDRVQLDRLLSQSPNRSDLMGLLRSMASFESRIDVDIRRLTWANRRLDGIRLAATGENGAFTIKEATIADFSGAAASFTGRITPEVEAFELATKIEVASPLRLVRLAVDDPPPAAALIRPIDIAGTISGNSESVEIDLVFEGDAYAGTFAATSNDLIDPITYQVDIGLVTDDLHGALQEFEDRTDLEPLLNGGADIQVRLAAVNGRVTTIDVDGRLGQIAVTTGLQAGEGPDTCLGGSIEVGPISGKLVSRLQQWLLPTSSDGGEPSDFKLGDWPDTLPDWQWLARASCRNTVMIEGDDGRVMNAALQRRPGRLELENIDMQIAGGTLKGSASVVASGAEVTEIAVDLALVDAELDLILDLIDLSPALDGAIDLDVKLVGSGRTIADVIASLEGNGSLVTRNLKIDRATDRIDLIEGGIVAEAGIVYSDMAASVTGSNSPQKRLRVVVDLPAWQLEASLSDASGATRYWLGRLDDVKEFAPSDAVSD